MGTALIIQQPCAIAFEDYADVALGPTDVRVRTLYSGISSGTELTAYRGTNPYLSKNWDENRRLFVAGETPRWQYPMKAIGYEESGEIVEVGADVKKVKPGDRIYGNWAHRTLHVAGEDWAAARRLPEGLDPICGVFSVIGAVALNAMLDAAVRLGETLAVFGLGTPGQIVCQMAKRSGARVIAVDMIDFRMSLARKMGWADEVLDARNGQVAEQIKTMTEGRGADVCVEMTGSYAALQEAIRSAAYSARVVASGFFQGAAAPLFLGEEFHHNRINVICSQISGVAPELSVRWNRARLEQTVMRLQAEGALQLNPLITHVIPFEQAGEAYRIADQEPEKAVQVVLHFER